MGKKIFLVEIVVFYALMALANWFYFPHMMGFLDVDPHPFWLGILLFGFGYGVTAGFLSGLVSTIVYIASAWASGEHYRYEELNFYLLPSFFIIFGVLIGAFTSRNRGKIDLLKKEKGEQEGDNQLLKEEIRTHQEINRGLEKKIVTRMATLITLYEGARRLDAQSLEELYPAILEFIAKTLDVEQAAIYLKDDEGWRLESKFGWKDFERRPTLIKANEGLTGLAGASNKVLSLRDFVGKEDLAPTPQFLGDSMLSGPIRLGERGDVLGVVSIQRIPFHHFNSASVNVFSFLLTWASRALERAKYIQDLKEQEVIDPEYQVYSTRYFHSRLRQEFLRSKTYYLPLSVGLFQVPELDYLKPKQKKIFLLMLSRLLQESTRDMDVVARHSEKLVPFSLLWITANEKQSKEMADAILEKYQRLNFDSLEFKLTLKIGKASFTPQTADERALLTLAAEDLK